MKRWPIIRHVRWLIWSWRVERQDCATPMAAVHHFGRNTLSRWPQYLERFAFAELWRQLCRRQQRRRRRPGIETNSRMGAR